MGDHKGEAFASLVVAHEKAMFRVILRLLPNVNDAEDALQEALLTTWRKWKRFESHPRPDLLLLRICTDAALDVLRKLAKRNARERRLDDGNTYATRNPSPREATEAEGIRRRLLYEIARLPRRQSLAMFLCLVEERSYSEAAQILDCTKATARSHVSKGVAKLRTVFEGLPL